MWPKEIRQKPKSLFLKNINNAFFKPCQSLLRLSQSVLYFLRQQWQSSDMYQIISAGQGLHINLGRGLSEFSAEFSETDKGVHK